MANTTANLVLNPYGKDGRLLDLPVAASTHIYAGSMVSQLEDGTGLVPTSTASSSPCVGVAQHEADNSSGAAGAILCRTEGDREFIFANATAGDACSDATLINSIVWAYDDHTVADNSNSGARKVAGLFRGMEPDGRVRVYVGFRALAQGEAAEIAIADAGGYTANTDVESALQELYANALATKYITIPLTAFREVDSSGAVGNAAANGGVLASDTTPILGAMATTEAMAIIFAATVVDVIATSISLPDDIDDAANMTVDLIVKTDNTGGGGIDAATYTVLSTFDNESQVSDAATDSSPATTVHTVTATIAAADVPASPKTLTLALVHAAHANDPTHLLGVRVGYTPTLQS